jgi:hypothetical protein
MSSATLDEGEARLLWVGVVVVASVEETSEVVEGVIDFGGGVQSMAVCRGPYNHVTSESLSLIDERG